MLELLKYRLLNTLLQSRLQLLEHFSVLHGHRILPVFVQEVAVDSFEHACLQLALLLYLLNSYFVQLYEPLIELFLFQILVVVLHHYQYHLLKRAHHVPKEAHSDHLNEDLKQVLDLGLAADVAVAD